MLCSNLICSSNDTVLLSNLSLSRPVDAEGEDETISLQEPPGAHTVSPLGGTSVLGLKGLMNTSNRHCTLGYLGHFYLKHLPLRHGDPALPQLQPSTMAMKGYGSKRLKSSNPGKQEERWIDDLSCRCPVPQLLVAGEGTSTSYQGWEKPWTETKT